MVSKGEVTVLITKDIGPDTFYDVYCYTEDYSAHIMPISLVLDAKVTIKTQCCKSAEFIMAKPAPRIPEITTVVENPAYGFRLSSRPSAPLYVNLTLVSHACPNAAVGTSKYFYMTTVAPSQFYFSGAPTEELESAFTVRGYQGCYTVDLIPFSPSGADIYSNDTIEIQIINTLIMSPDVPVLKSVLFSSDGQNILFNFDTPTNAPIFNNQTVFPCLEIVDFIGVDNDLALCKWLNLKVLQASLGFDSTLKPEIVNGDTGDIRAGVIRAQCASSTVAACNNYPTVPFTSLVIGTPEDAIVPYVSLSSSKSVGSCDDIIMDPTGGSGHGGRNWRSVSWAVQDGEQNNPNHTAMVPIQNYLNENYATGSVLTTIPNELLTQGSTYYISLTLTNFMLKSSTAALYVSVTTNAATPQLSIAGPSMIIKYRSQDINLFAVATIPKCAGDVSNEGISYVWKVYRGPTFEDAIVSYSADPRYFKLAPFTLEGSSEYTIQVTAIGYSADNINPPISYYSVLIQVGQSGVEAVIAGGRKQTNAYTDGVLLDGSQSYDLDASPSSPSNLVYQWTCMISDPDYGFPCANFPNATSTIGRYLYLPPETLEVKTIYAISLTVYNDYNMSSKATIDLKVVQNDVPKVTLSNTLLKYNKNEKIVLTGTVVAKGTDATTSWSSDALSNGLSLDQVTNTPLDFTLIPGTNILQMSIMRGILVEGLEYTFYLSSSYVGSDNNDQGIASVSILMNQSPSGGALTISPTNGVALNTTFTFQTSGWSDDPDDYPLAYIFAYYVYRSDQQLIVKSSSELSYSDVTLGQGQTGNGKLICLTNASDIYGATGQALNVQVRVNPLANVEDLKNLAKGSINRAFRFKDPGAISQVLSAVTTQLNSVNCGVPIGCSLLNRASCSTTRKTCGPCLGGYTGVAGDSNVPCGGLTNEVATDLSVRRRLEIVSSIDSNDFGDLEGDNDGNSTLRRTLRRQLQSSIVYRMIASGERCSTASTRSACISGVCEVADVLTQTIGVCAPITKSCPNECNGNGNCAFIDMHDNAVTTCLATDMYCRAECSCFGGWKGLDCAIPNADVESIKELRDSVCTNLQRVQSIQNENEDTILSRATLVAKNLIDYTVVSEDAYEVCVKVLVDTVLAYPAVAGSQGLSAIFSDAFSNILKKRSFLSEYTLNNVTAGIEALTLGFQENLAIGEDATSIVSPNLRLMAGVMSPSSLEDSTFQFPRTAYENFDGTAQESVKFNASMYMAGGSASGVIVGFAVSVLTNNPTALKTNSSVVSVRTTTYGADSRRRSLRDNRDRGKRRSRRLRRLDESEMHSHFPVTDIGVTVDLQNSVPLTYTEIPVSNVEVECFRTRNGPYITSHQCPTGEYINMECPGNKGFYNLTCPSYTDAPQCQVWDGYDFRGNPLCKAIEYSSANTVCECQGGDANALLAALALAALNGTNNSSSSSSDSSSSGNILTHIDTYSNSSSNQKKLRNRNLTKLKLNTAQSQFNQFNNGGGGGKYGKYGGAYGMSMMDTQSTSFSLVNIMSNHLDDPTSENVEQQFSASMIVVATSFSYAFTAAPPIFERQHDFIVLGSILGICGLFFILLILMLRTDTSELRKARKTKLTDKNMVRTSKDFFESLLPREFEDRPWLEKLGDWIKTEHTWFSIWAKYDDHRDYRTIKVLTLFSNLLAFLFMSSLLAMLSFGPDDGSCENINFENECNSRTTSWGTRSDCVWEPTNTSCGYLPPDVDALAVIVYCAIVTLFSVPIAKSLEFMIRCLLTEKHKVIASGESPFFLHFGSYFKIGWSIKELQKFGLNKSGQIVPVNEDGDAESVMEDNKGKGDVDIKKHGRGNGNDNGDDDDDASSLGSRGPEDEMGEYWEKCDELQDSQTLSSRMLRAARLRKLQEYTDYVLPMMEVEMLIALSDHDLKYFGRQILITDTKNASLEWKSNTIKRARYAMVARNGKRQLLGKVNHARREMEVLKAEIETIEDTEDQEKYMIRQFILDNLTGFRRNLAQRYMLGEGRYHSVFNQTYRDICKYASMILVPLIWAALIYYVMLYNISIGSRASTLWIVITMSSLLIDALFLQPLRLWIKYVVINSTVAKDVRDITGAMGLRFVSIIQRKAGVMRDANNIVQHFNPACRVARLFPHLPISRFLLSLNDYDVPHFSSHTTPVHLLRGWDYWSAMAMSGIFTFLYIVTSTPAVTQDIVTEILITMSLDIVCVVLYYVGVGSTVMAILIALGIIGSIYGRDWYVNMCEYV